MKIRLFIILISIVGCTSCQQKNSPVTIDISKDWRFSPDKNNTGISGKWYSVGFDDSEWDTIHAGLRWENQGYPDLDSLAWYRKLVEIPVGWKGKDVWLKFGAVNDAYELFVNGKSVSSFGEANISFAGKPSFTNITDRLDYGRPNLIVVKVNDWGNSGGLWRLPAIITTDKSETDLFKPLTDKLFFPEKEGYELFWEDEFNGNMLDSSKWLVRGVGPRGVGYVSSDAVEVKNGVLKLHAFMENDSLKVGAVGTQGLFETSFGYFECKARLPETTGNWAAFWIQSPKISQGEDPARYGTEIDIFEYFKAQGGDFV